MLCERKKGNDVTHIMVNGYILPCKHIVKLLGLNIDETLSFDIHTLLMYYWDRLEGWVVWKNKWLFLKLSYFLLLPICPTTWHFCSKRMQNIMEKLHEHGLKFVTNDFNRNYEERLVATNCNKMFLWRLQQNSNFYV